MILPESLNVDKLIVKDEVLIKLAKDLVGDHGYWRCYQKIYRDIAENVRVEDENRKCADHWAPIPNNVNEALCKMVAMIHVARELEFKNINFMDCGCGAGNILSLFYHVNNEHYYGPYGSSNRSFHQSGKIFGLELRKDVATVGNLITPRDVEVKQGDLFEFKDYHKFNAVYYYCTIKNPHLEMLFEEMLEDAVKPGTILMPSLKRSGAYSRDDRFKFIKSAHISGSGMTCGSIGIKIKSSDRKATNLKAEDINSIPDNYHALFKKHIKCLEKTDQDEPRKERHVRKSTWRRGVRGQM